MKSTELRNILGEMGPVANYANLYSNPPDFCSRKIKDRVFLKNLFFNRNQRLLEDILGYMPGKKSVKILMLPKAILTSSKAELLENSSLKWSFTKGPKGWFSGLRRAKMKS